MPVSCSIIVPVLNEAAGLPALFAALAPLRAAGSELIVVDGGSDDDSVAVARRHCERVIVGPRGRARQMNAGAAVAGGDWLLFLHADTGLPADALLQLARATRTAGRREPVQWGRFDVRLAGRSPWFRVIETLMNLRSRWTGIATGDQALFVQRARFEQLGGFPDLELMEDIELCRLLKAGTRPLCLPGPAVTSSRRWEQQGVLKTVLLMWRLRLAWFLGADHRVLAKRYRAGGPTLARPLADRLD